MFGTLKKISLLSAALICVAVSFGASANQDDKQTIVVGVITQRESADSILDSIGPFYGINLDYLANITKVLNLKLELRAYKHIVPLLNDVESGVIDGAVGFSKTPEREKHFLFSKPFFSSTIAVWYRDENSKNREIQNLKWVCVEGSVYCDGIKALGASDVHYVKTRAEAFDEVRSGRAHALVSTYVAISQYLDKNNVINGVVDIPNWLHQEEVSFIASLKQNELIDQINRILEWEQSGRNIRSVASQNRYHITDKMLIDYRKTYGSDHVITYSSSEQAFPFLSSNPESGDVDGFLPDFIELIQARTGLSFQFNKPKSSLNSGLTEFNADLVPVAYVDQVPVSDWLLTQPFMQDKFVAVQAKSQVETFEKPNAGILLSFNKQGVVPLDTWQEKRFKRYSDLKALLSDLKQGALDVAYVPDDIVHSMIVQDNVDGLTISENNTLSFSIAFAVANHDAQLKNVLDSVIATIDSNEIEKLLRSYRNFNLVYGYNDKQITIMAFVGAAVFAVFLIIAYFILAHLRLKVNLAELNANNEEKEKQWLMDIIQEINSLVFIHSEDNHLEMSNCARYQSGQCKQCFLQSVNTARPLVDNEGELACVIRGQRISEETAASGCVMGISYVHRERKTIAAPNGKKKFVLTVVHDITQQKAREQALMDAQKEAQSAVRARENFLATMSHELRTPISATHGILDLLEHQVLEPSSRALLAQAMRALRHLNTLVDEVLDYSKLEAGQLNIVPVKTDLLPVLCDVLKGFEPKARDKGLDFKVTIKPISESVFEVDSLRLVQIMTNLLSNAVKFTSEGEIATSIVVQNEQLTLKVADTGIGMSENQVKGVLSPFVQADDTITRKFGGTGLGLSIVDRLVDCMGGNLMIDSQYGLGTTITVRLPVTACEAHAKRHFNWTYSESLPLSIRQWCEVWGMAPASVDPDLVAEFDHNEHFIGVMFNAGDRTTTSLSKQDLQYPCALFRLFSQEQHVQQGDDLQELQIEAIHWASGTVLVAEDNPINQSVVHMQLQKLGIQPVIVNNGREAWEYINKAKDVELILTDFHMPEMDGFELVQKVKSSPQFQSIPIVGVTAEDSRLANNKAKDIGIDDVLYKPYDLNDLRTILLPFIAKEHVSHTSKWIEKYNEIEAMEIAKIFNTSMEIDINNLKTLPTENELKRVIHGIKGAVGAVGLDSLADLCIKAEQAAGMEFEKRIGELILRIEREVESINKWICIHE